jgi:hypothetical protein
VRPHPPFLDKISVIRDNYRPGPITIISTSILSAHCPSPPITLYNVQLIVSRPFCTALLVYRRPLFFLLPVHHFWTRIPSPINIELRPSITNCHPIHQRPALPPRQCHHLPRQRSLSFAAHHSVQRSLSVPAPHLTPYDFSVINIEQCPSTTNCHPFNERPAPPPRQCHLLPRQRSLSIAAHHFAQHPAHCLALFRFPYFSFIADYPRFPTPPKLLLSPSINILAHYHPFPAITLLLSHSSFICNIPHLQYHIHLFFE